MVVPAGTEQGAEAATAWTGASTSESNATKIMAKRSVAIGVRLNDMPSECLPHLLAVVTNECGGCRRTSVRDLYREGNGTGAAGGQGAGECPTDSAFVSQGRLVDGDAGEAVRERAV